MTWDAADLEQGPLPLWFQIADRLRAAIGRGDFRPGEALPSEAQLNERFGVSRTTARASLDKLEQEGLISRRSGKGSIVLTPRVEQPLNLLASFAEDMKRRGFAPSYVTQSAGPAGAPLEVASALGVERRSPVFRSIRLLRADGWPIGISESWIAPAIIKPNEGPDAKTLDAGSLYSWLERTHGARITGGHEVIEAAAATRAQAESLKVAVGAPLLVARRRAHAQDGEPIEYVVTRYRSDRYRFHVDLVRQ